MCTRTCTHARENAMKSKLPREIISLVNRKSHAAGVAYAEKEKKRLQGDLEALRAEGKSLQDLQEYLNRNKSICNE